jgi:N-acetylglucosamine-6-phosphate deacetylase
MPPVGGVRPTFLLAGVEIAAQDGRCVRPDGTLAGTTLDMMTAVSNCVHLLDLSLEKALRLASLEPAEFLGRAHEFGRLAPGYRADMLAFDPAEFRVLETWIAGV